MRICYEGDIGLSMSSLIGGVMRISAIFGPTIQGEGKSIGLRVMFVRLAACNLHCVWCDTPYTWDWSRFDRLKEVHHREVNSIVAQLQAYNVKAVVISGGEPLLQQKELTELVVALKRHKYWIEIETNGTMLPNTTLTTLVDQFNCSPKLENSGDAKGLRIKPDVLRALVANKKTNFKFVVSRDEDIAEILVLVHEFKMEEVYLMPEGITKEALAEKESIVKALCEEYGFKFSGRIHITKLGGGRLV